METIRVVITYRCRSCQGTEIKSHPAFWLGREAHCRASPIPHECDPDDPDGFGIADPIWVRFYKVESSGEPGAVPDERSGDAIAGVPVGR